MIKGALFTIGILTTLGGGALGVLMVFASAMSDVPGQNSSTDLVTPGAIAAVGIAMIIGACFL